MRGDRVFVRRLAIVVVCLVSLAGACLLAWWQWNRYESASGSWQNLGYVLQWPLFGLFPAFMVWRIRRLRQRERESEERAGAGPVAAPPRDVPRPRRPEPPRTTRDEPDDELAAYNRYLAELNAKDRHDRP
ncbi:DNA-binding transcriptional regulator of glucitol operon [Kibdelosporangium sp. 4NS15]|uniref:DNA-binding transcriptional regulator of glucitol operon n=1 Tax=Kibdelosporangium persicum TaxID=2698649 RepID=A0ABX2EWM1_9PSEU|nr:hypothetical protein [Kibdelosporangium persicum]NRN63430.1 DNA-binding transcriptional regulator of glucitol operon [Kibdelosporangium persicum]